MFLRYANIPRCRDHEISTNLDDVGCVSGIFGCHWPNLLHEDKNRHNEVVDGWVRYFERCANTFGTILSRDIAFAASQSLYRAYAKVNCTDGIITIDLTDVPSANGLNQYFFVSAKSDIGKFDGCELSVHEKKNGFTNYKVTPKNKILIFEI